MSTITVKLGAAHSEKVEELAALTGVAPEQLVRDAIDAYVDAIGTVEAEPDFTPEQIAAIEEGLAAIERGDVVSHEDVFAALEAKYGP